MMFDDAEKITFRSLTKKGDKPLTYVVESGLYAELNGESRLIGEVTRRTIDLEEKQVEAAAVAILRAKGYTVIEPPTPSGHRHECWQLQESAKGGMYCAACGEDVER